MPIPKELLTWMNRRPSGMEDQYNRIGKLANTNRSYSSEKNPDAHLYRRWLRKAVDEYISMGWSMSARVIEGVWTALTDEAYEGRLPDLREVPNRHGPRNEGHRDRPLSKSVIGTLFDFSTNAISYTYRGQHDNRIVCSHSDADRVPTGINAHQAVFLEEPPYRDVDTAILAPLGSLDKFAKSFADAPGNDGVHCVAGVRGSGKTTFLNRISWYCEKWSAVEGRPLLISFDLGTDFNDEPFLKRVITDVCLASKRTLGCQVAIIDYLTLWAVRAVGRLGHFCRANIPWAMAVAVVLTILIGRAASVPPSETHPAPSCTSDGLDFMRVLQSDADTCAYAVPFLGTWSVMDIQLLYLILVGTVGVGFAYSIRGVVPNLWETGYRKLEGRGVMAARSVLIALLVIALLLDIYIGLFQLEQGSLLPYGIGMALVTVAILLLPRWWESYMYFERTLMRLRTERRGFAAEWPLLASQGGIGWIVARLLPTTEESNQIDKISEPFLEELAKNVLKECAACFPRTVVLIDDVDAVPSSQFSELLRQIRPLGKVPGVRCLMAIPMVLHAAFRNQQLGDLHSAIRSSCVVGNPELFPDWRQNPGTITEDRNAFREFLENLVISRIRPKFSAGARDADDDLPHEQNEYRHLSPVQYILEPWLDEDGSGVSDNAVRLIQRFGHSRRELIRMLETTLEASWRGPGAVDVNLLLSGFGDDFVRREKQAYGMQESVLDCVLWEAGGDRHGGHAEGSEPDVKSGGRVGAGDVVREDGEEGSAEARHGQADSGNGGKEAAATGALLIHDASDAPTHGEVEIICQRTEPRFSAGEARRIIGEHTVTLGPDEETLNSNEVAARLGLKSRQSVHNWRRKGKILGWQHGKREYLFPARQFDERNQPIGGLSEIMALFEHAYSSWLWLTTPRTSLDGEEPLNLLARGERERVTDAAKGHLQGDFG